MDSTSGTPSTAAQADFLSGGGELGERMRAFDWSTTSLGPPSTWPQSLKTFVGIILSENVSSTLTTTELRLEANRALRQSEERYRSLTEATAAIVWTTSAEGQFATEQPSWTAFTGQSTAELMGNGWLAAIHPEDRESTAESWRRTRADGASYHHEQRLRRHDGEYRYMVVRAVPLRNDDGSVREWIGLHTDVTVERELERTLESERVGLRDIFTRAPAFIATLKGPDHVFEVVNPPYMRLIGETRDVLGKPVREALPEVAGQGFFELLDRVFETGEPFLGSELRVALGDDVLDERFVDFVYQPVRGLNGEVTGIFVHGNDITEQVRARQVVERQADELEEANLALLEAQEALKEADRRKDEFIATLSHELRTPLTAILGWARLLRMGDNDLETIDTAVETINRSAEAQAQLIDDVLDISRITTGKIQIASDVVDAADVARAATETVRLAATAKGVQLLTDVPSHSTLVLGDANRLQQVIWNLLANAIKFTPEGGTVELLLKQTGGRITLRVRDSGIGIPSHFLPHIFEPFRQAEGATTRVYGGLGLGLSIVRYLVELHGGVISAESAGNGTGATFVVDLPRLRSAAASADRPEVSANLVSASDMLELPRIDGRRVLVIDDQDDVRDYVASVLRRAGADVEQADSVRNAITSMQAQRPDVILCDIAMPNENGFTFLNWLREQPEHAALPILALTAFAGEKEEHEALAAGFNAYLRKPVEPETIVRAVESATVAG